MGKANTNDPESFGDSAQRPAELVDLEKASEALEIPREVLWGLIQHEAVPVHTFHGGMHDFPAIYQRDLDRLRSSSPPNPSQVFARMFGGSRAAMTPVAKPAPAAESFTPAPELSAVAFDTELEDLRAQLALAKAELEKHSQPLWVRVRTIEHEHDQAVFAARLATGELSDAKTRLAHSEETLAVLQRDLAKAVETSELERRKRQSAEENQQRLVAACERYERVNQRLTEATEELATVRSALDQELAKAKENEALQLELMAEREKLAAVERRFFEAERTHADELRAREQASATQVSKLHNELGPLRQSHHELQGRFEASERGRSAQERYCERIEVRLSEALARITKLQRLMADPPQRSAAA